MMKNESSIDRLVRVVVAVVAIVIAFVVGAGSVLGIILFVVAAIMLITASLGYCPVYRLIGFRTKK